MTKGEESKREKEVDQHNILFEAGCLMCITTNARYPAISLLTIRLGNLRLHKES